ncbi:unnamed protein product [Caenorhabditis auriculariae]|uniref:diacylglycerol cholinephosphotransferase n=1 Tax=Caenorhabditis auriculariae TaxID=2777116 RepID=A0A8S1HDM0_9PELO|nr:unnamed protein product [Caenorhabditis auriculariae]
MSCARGLSARLYGYLQTYIRIDCLATPQELKKIERAQIFGGRQQWWEFAVTLCPMWVAPNLITLVGLIGNLVTVLVLSSFSYSATGPAPSWAYIQAALGLFIYQTLDAIDGKQARRTGSSSPLGELFDHGCDSLTQVFVTLNVCYAMSLGTMNSCVLIVSVISVVMFYCAHWSTYCTGQLRFSRFDVTEAQMSVISVLLFTALFGNAAWGIQILGYELKFFVVYLSFAISFYQIYGYIHVIFSGGVGKNGSTIAGTSHITLFCLCFGAVGAKATNRLVIAHMAKSELRLWDWIYIGPFLMMLNQYYDTYFDEYTLLIFVTVYCYVSLLTYCVVVCRQFCEFLNIYILMLR